MLTSLWESVEVHRMNWCSRITWHSSTSHLSKELGAETAWLNLAWITCQELTKLRRVDGRLNLIKRWVVERLKLWLDLTSIRSRVQHMVELRLDLTNMSTV